MCCKSLLQNYMVLGELLVLMQLAIRFSQGNLLTRKKTVDISALPPCESVLKLHCQRANYPAGIWKRSVSSQTSTPSPVYHGWNPDKSLTLCTEIP